MQVLYSANYVARHLGVERAVVLNWADRPTAAFPMPVASVRYGDRASQVNLAWGAGQLPLLRDWLGRRLGLSDPAAHWALVDSGGQPPGGHLDQGALFGDED